MDVRGILDDLSAEHTALDSVVAPLDDSAWSLPTPSVGWTVADQIAHLTYFDRTATIAISDPEDFSSSLDELLAALAEDPAAMDDLTLGWSRDLSAEQLLARWRAGRRTLIEAAATLEEADRVPWYGPSMGAKSFLTARLMETWAHGQDVADAVGTQRAATDRLRHIARLGVLTRGWSYMNRGLEPAESEVRVELVAPSGAVFEAGPAGAHDCISGPMEHFCLVVTQRRHVADTDLMVRGEAAAEWMSLAQAFAGGPTQGPAPR